MDFKSLILSHRAEKNLQENTLYKDAAEKAALLANKDKIAEAFVYNFLGMLGLINATSSTQHALLRSHFMKDKKVRIDNIDDTNHDISLVVKLAKDAGFFKNDTVVNNITRFLAKLKAGQIDQVDSKLIAGWLEDMTSSFFSDIRDAQTKRHVLEFKADGGKTIDISRLAIKLKTRVNKVAHGGEYKAFAKTFGYLKEKDLTAQPATQATATVAAPVAQAPAAPATDGKKRVRRTKAEMQAFRAALAAGMTPDQAKAATSKTAAVTAPVVAVPVAPPPPVKPAITELTPRLRDMEDLFRYIYADSSETTRVLGNMKMNLRRYGYSDEMVKYIDEKFDAIREKMIPILNLDVASVRVALADAMQFIRDAKMYNDSSVSDDNILYAMKSYYNYNAQSAYGEYTKHLYEGLYYYPDTSKLLAMMAERYSADTHALVEKLEASKLADKDNIVELILKEPSFNRIVNQYTYGKVSDGPKTNTGMLYSVYAAKLHYSGKSLLDLFTESSSSYSYRANSIMKQFIYETNSAGSWTFARIRPLDIMIKKIHELTTLQLPSDMIEEIIISAYENDPYSYKIDDDVVQILKKTYEKDLLDNGIEKAKVTKLFTYDRSLLAFIKVLGYTLDDFSKKFPEDRKILEMKIKADGIDSITTAELVSYAEYKAYKDYDRGNRMSFEEFKQKDQSPKLIMDSFKSIFRSSKNAGDKIGEAIKTVMDSNPAGYDKSEVFGSMMKLIPEMDKNIVIDLIRVAKKHDFKKFFDPEIYKNTSRRAEKDEFKSLVTGVMHDCIGSDVEDYFSDILENMPGGVIDAIRKSLVGMNALVDEVNKGVIQPFDAIGDKRLKQMLAMNDIDLASLVSDAASRRKRNEKWGDYFKRVKDELKSKGSKSFLGKEKVDLDTSANVKKISKTYNQNFHAGRHGNIYAKVLKAFNASVRFPEFAEFRKNKFGDGEVVPAFHGTGGIAATMILRYGFKVIKSTDPSVVGRMLGDGIYFSNKLDKALQYVSNSGYGRDYGSKGYIFELDVNLGKKANSGNDPDYRAMGLGNDHIRSPEWCVRDAKAQTAIKRVYEVELVSKDSLDKYTINESTGRVGFREFMKENIQLKNSNNLASFTFRDGLIPIVTEDGNMTFVDFEDAIKDNAIPQTMVDYSRQGPVIVFEGADKQEAYDIRFAETINGDAYESYVKNFKRAILSAKE